MDIFNKVCMGIRNLMLEIAMHHLISTIRSDRFTESLTKRPTKNLDELKNRATKFMQIEEHTDYHISIQSVSREKKEKDKGNWPTSSRPNCFREIGPPTPYLHPLTVPRCRRLAFKFFLRVIFPILISKVEIN